MPFNDLSDTQRKFLAAYTKAGKTLSVAVSTPVDPAKAERTEWLDKVNALRTQIKAAPPSLDTSKLITALDKAQRIFEADFKAPPAAKALTTIKNAFAKASATTSLDTATLSEKLDEARSTFANVMKLAFPDKKTVGAKIQAVIDNAQARIDTGEFSTALRLIDTAQTLVAGARVGIDANAAKDLKPADLEVLMKTKDGRAQLDSIVDNLTDDVPPNVMMSILEARFSLGRKLFQNTSDREGSMLDKAKHGAMLETDSPKLKKLYKKLMDRQAAKDNQAE